MTPAEIDEFLKSQMLAKKSGVKTGLAGQKSN
jgi:hypothetical protein